MTSIQGHQLLRQDSVQIGSIELNLDLAGIQVSDFGRLLPFAKDRFGSIAVIERPSISSLPAVLTLYLLFYCSGLGCAQADFHWDG